MRAKGMPKLRFPLEMFEGVVANWTLASAPLGSMKNTSTLEVGLSALIAELLRPRVSTNPQLHSMNSNDMGLGVHRSFS